MQAPHIRDVRGGRVHMIGIGGSSMSGLAEILQSKGYRVTGSDRSDGYLLPRLREMGIPVTVGQRRENVVGADFAVFTAAIPPENPERAACAELGIPCIERSVLLGQLSEEYPVSVSVCGTDGKTTTTSMLSQILMEQDRDPTIHIGGVLDAIGGSVHVGTSDLFVTEACEFNRSFLELRPTIAVVTNIREDHLDCYKDIDDIEATFGRFLSLLPVDGLAIGRGADERVIRQMKQLSCHYETFGLEPAYDWYAGDLTEDKWGRISFGLMHQGEKLGQVSLRVAGRFNAEDALAALAAASALGCDMKQACASVSTFIGAHRRFELTDTVDGVEIFTDYGHNPQEMTSALSIARKRCGNGRLWAVMQPHTFSRVRRLFNEYMTCTAIADFTLVTDICAAREPDPGDLNSGMLVDGMKKNGIDAVWTPSFDDTEAYLRTHWQPGDLVLTMGCGDINLLNMQIHRHEAEKKNAGAGPEEKA